MKTKHNKIQLMLVFALTLIYFYNLQFSTQNLVGYDAYANIKTAYLYRTEGILHEFPWYYYTSIRENYADQQFLFRLLLIPFTFGDLILGAKIAIVIFSSLTIIVIYWFLIKYRIKYPLVWLVILLSSSHLFLHYLNFVRPISLSIFFLILGIYFLDKKKYGLLFILSAVFSMVYVGVVLLLSFCLVYVIIDKIKNKKLNLKPIYYSFSGTLIGLVLVPNFIKRMYLLTFPSIIIPFTNIPLKTPIQEWDPIPLAALFSESTIVFFLFLIATILFFRKKQSTLTASLFVFSVLFLIFTLKFNRIIVYWIPFSIIFSVFMLNKQIKKQKLKGRYRYITLFFVLLILIMFFSNFITTRERISLASNFNNYEGCANWLNKNTPNMSHVFIMTWSQSPALFYYNLNNVYTLGGDEHFLYFYDKSLYFKYIGVTRGVIKDSDKIKKILKKDFNSSYIFLDDQDCILTKTYFYDLVKNDKNFIKKYEDKYCSVYKVK